MKYVIRINTQDEYDLLMQYFVTIGKTWSGVRADRKNYFGEYNDLCINPNNEKTIGFGSEGFYKGSLYNYTVISLKEFMVSLGYKSAIISDGSEWVINGNGFFNKSLHLTNNNLSLLHKIIT